MGRQHVLAGGRAHRRGLLGMRQKQRDALREPVEVGLDRDMAAIGQIEAFRAHRGGDHGAGHRHGLEDLVLRAGAGGQGRHDQRRARNVRTDVRHRPDDGHVGDIDRGCIHRWGRVAPDQQHAMCDTPCRERPGDGDQVQRRGGVRPVAVAAGKDQATGLDGLGAWAIEVRVEPVRQHVNPAQAQVAAIDGGVGLGHREHRVRPG